MKIGYDLRRIGNPGIGRYMRRLVSAILRCAPHHDYVLIMAPRTSSLLDIPATAKITIVETNLPYYSIREQFGLRTIAAKQELDLFHSPHFVTPLMPCCPTVITIHDVIYIACREDMESSLGRFYYASMMKAAVRRAHRIITVSEFSRGDIVRFLGTSPDKIEVVLNGVDDSFSPVDDPGARERIAQKYGVRRPFILYTGIYKGRKNHAGLLRAFAKVRAVKVEVELVIAGALGEGKTVLERMARELGIDDYVRCFGFVEEADLPTLYSAACAYACPSTYEGFGFTILEAAACGTPVVANPVASLPEVGRDAVLWADATSAEEFGAALVRVCKDEPLRRDLIRKGLNNVKRFRWENAARQTAAIYEQVAGHGAKLASAATVAQR